MTKKLEDRLEWLLNGRKIHKWGANIGLTKTVITRLNQGIFPGADKLRPVVRAENVSLTWLLEGKGDKYLVNHCWSDIDCYECLQAYYDEKWKTHLLVDGFNISIVLTQPGSYDIEGVTYLYTMVEVITGPINDKTLSLIAQQNNDNNTFFVETSVADMQFLFKGNVGSYGLLHAADAILNKSRLLKQVEAASFITSSQVAEDAPPAYHVPSKITSDEMATVVDLRQLNPQNLKHIKAVIHSLADSSDKRTDGKTKK
jgi:hypothetical protein